jgi:hypothetical protein
MLAILVQRTTHEEGVECHLVLESLRDLYYEPSRPISYSTVRYQLDIPTISQKVIYADRSDGVQESERHVKVIVFPFALP